MSKKHNYNTIEELESRIEQLEAELTEQSNFIGNLQVALEEAEEELAVTDARLCDLEEVMDKLRWAVSEEE